MHTRGDIPFTECVTCGKTTANLSDEWLIDSIKKYGVCSSRCVVDTLLQLQARREKLSSDEEEIKDYRSIGVIDSQIVILKDLLIALQAI